MKATGRRQVGWRNSAKSPNPVLGSSQVCCFLVLHNRITGMGHERAMCARSEE